MSEPPPPRMFTEFTKVLKEFNTEPTKMWFVTETQDQQTDYSTIATELLEKKETKVEATFMSFEQEDLCTAPYSDPALVIVWSPTKEFLNTNENAMKWLNEVFLPMLRTIKHMVVAKYKIRLIENAFFTNAVTIKMKE